MSVSAELLDGRTSDSEQILKVLREDVFPAAIHRMNADVLPFQFARFDVDRLPTNQRNLGDVRTRVGPLLEYELAKAVTAILPETVLEQVVLTYVIANKYPDLAFRTHDGGIGVRFEVKAIETVAEEPAANFDTLIKDIRKGTDFVVTMLWEWRRHGDRTLQFPHIDAVFILDAYQLAQMRDCYWLNRPPKDVGDGRQGFDLCFGVNCKKNKYNQEKGNYGKSLRIFDPQYEALLPHEVLCGTTLPSYYELRREVATLGLRRIGSEIANAFADGREASVRFLSDSLPTLINARNAERTLLVHGDYELPQKLPDRVSQTMTSSHAAHALLLNEKFKWRVRDRDGQLVAAGEKPATAIEWVRSQT